MNNDMQMQQDVLAALDREQDVIAGSIGVEVHHGVVKCAGRVRDDSIMDSSEVAVRRVDGVTSVIMDVDVADAGAAPRTPGDVTRKARPV